MFKFIISPTCFTRNQPGKDHWGWLKFEKEQQKILQHIVDKGITGVVVISGDTHTIGFFELFLGTGADRKPTGVYEVNAAPWDASGKSKHPYGPNGDDAIFEQDNFNIFDTILIHSHHVHGKQFAQLDVDTESAEKTVTVKLFSDDYPTAAFTAVIPADTKTGVVKAKGADGKALKALRR